MFKFLLIMLIGVNFSLSAKDSFSYADIEKKLNKYQEKIEYLQEHIDATVFDDEEILLSLDFDADAVVAFMRDKIAFQAYDGLLRGVKGTLVSRAGNALDQSLLLAKLLGDTGMEARIAHGKLDEAMAKLLLSQLSSATLPNKIGTSDEYKKALAQLSKNKSDEINWSKTETYKHYQASLKSINKVLKNNNINLSDKNITSSLIKQVQDYFWVQYRTDPSSDWVSAHPAFKKAQNMSVIAEEYFKKDIPDKYMHKLKIEAFIEQKVGDKLTTHALMSAWERPVANLFDKVISYRNAPSGLQLSGEFDFDKIINDTKYFTPIFNGKAVGGKVFDLSGRLIDSEAMESDAGGLFQMLGDKNQSALDKLSFGKENKYSTQLTASWLQFSFIQPNGQNFVQKRYLYQAIDNKNKEKRDYAAKAQLVSQYQFLVSSGDYPVGYLANTYLEIKKSGLPLLKSSAKYVYGAADNIIIPKTNTNNAFELLTQYSFLSKNPDSDKNSIQYKAVANLIGFKRGFVNAKKDIFTVDIINNKQKHFKVKGDQIFHDSMAALKQGVWDTATEWLPALQANGDDEQINSLTLTQAAEKQNIPITLIQKTQKSTLAKQLNNKNVKQIIQADLDQSFAVLIPNKTPENSPMTAWWRINLETGETLGMTADGSGGSLSEHAIQTVQNELLLVRTLVGIKKCKTIANPYKKMCCLMDLYINTANGAAIGSAFGAMVGTSASAIFDIIDFRSEILNGSGYIPSVTGNMCKKFKPPRI